MSHHESMDGDRGCRGIPWPKSIEDVRELLARLVALRQRALASPLRWRVDARAKAADLHWAFTVIRCVQLNVDVALPAKLKSKRVANARVAQAMCNADYFAMREVYAHVANYVTLEEARAAMDALGPVRWIRRPREAGVV
jgi:hypothetical protein